MTELEGVVGLVLAAVLLAAAARRVGVPYPVFLAVGAVGAGSFSFASVAPTFLIAVAGSLIVGPALAWLFLRAMEDVEDVPTAIILQFVSTFGVWIVAERIGLSGVLTMVCYAIT